MSAASAPLAPPAPRIRLSIGVTGHRESNAAFAANRAAIEATLAGVFDAIAAAVAAEPPLLGPNSLAPTRLQSMLVDGLDQMASAQALARGWELAAPLPFGRALNVAINAHPESVEEARSLLTGKGKCGAATRARAKVIADLEAKARVFELADRDETIAALYLARLEEPTDVARAQAYSFQTSERVALAAQVLIETALRQGDRVSGEQRQLARAAGPFFRKPVRRHSVLAMAVRAGHVNLIRHGWLPESGRH